MYTRALRCRTFEDELGEKRPDSTTALAGNAGKKQLAVIVRLSWLISILGNAGEISPTSHLKCQRILLKFISQQAPAGRNGDGVRLPVSHEHETVGLKRRMLTSQKPQPKFRDAEFYASSSCFFSRTKMHGNKLCIFCAVPVWDLRSPQDLFPL